MIAKRSEKKGISTVIATLLLVALTIILVGVVWTMVNNIVRNNINSANACYNTQGKVTLNNDYTCYNNSGANPELVFSINVADLSIDDIIVSISNGQNSTSFWINRDNATSGLLYLNRTPNALIPAENHGLTYVFPLPSYYTDAPENIKITPVIEGQTCSNIDSISQFDLCSDISGF